MQHQNNRHLSPTYFDGVQTPVDGIRQIFPDRMTVRSQELVIEASQGCVCVSGDEIVHFYLFHEKNRVVLPAHFQVLQYNTMCSMDDLGSLNLRDTQFNDNCASFTSIV